MRDLSLTLSVMAIAIILSTSHSGLGASGYSTAPTSNGTDTSICLDEFCQLLAHRDVELEFQMPSEITRRFLGSQPYVTPGTSINNKPAGNVLCRKSSCAPAKNPPGKYINPNCGSYSREPNCPRRK